MAWNSTNNQSLEGTAQQKAAIGPGAPIATNPTLAGEPYFDPWDIERAHREGMQKVTWVARCIDVIAVIKHVFQLFFAKEMPQTEK